MPTTSRRSPNGRTSSTTLTTIFEVGDIIWVPFPHVERPVLVPRPGLVVTRRPIGPRGLLIWTAMITNAARSAWPGDIDIPNASAIGLLIPSKVRTAKVNPAEAASAQRIGRLDEATLGLVRKAISEHLGFD